MTERPRESFLPSPGKLYRITRGNNKFPAGEIVFVIRVLVYGGITVDFLLGDVIHRGVSVEDFLGQTNKLRLELTRLDGNDPGIETGEVV